MSVETKAFWDEMYRGRDGLRHREPHPYLPTALASVTPGRALELGCGDGVGAVWLASHGWTVTAVDVSEVALGIAAERAERAGVPSRITWQRADLADWTTQETFDLVTAFFLHSPLELNCAATLARVAGQTREGGILLSVGHYTLPPWAWDPDDTDSLLRASELAAAIGLRDHEWRIVVADEVERAVTGHDGQAATVLDAVLHAVRTAHH